MSTAAIMWRGLRVACAAVLCGTMAPPAGAIVGGSLDPNSSATPFGGVASLTRSTGGVFSAVLIDRDYALTAAHVVFGSSPTGWTLNLNAGGNLTSQLGIQSIFIAPGYAGFAPDPDDDLVHNDLAVLELATPAPVDVPVYPISSLAPGAALTFLGYGASGAFGATLTPASATAKYLGTNTADLFPSKPGLGTPPFYDVFAFDVDAGTGDATFAGGDSGGPSFVNTGGAWKLVGINTFVFTATISDGTSLRGGGGMVLTAYQPWIRQVTGIPEPGNWALLAGGLAALALRRTRWERLSRGSHAQQY